MVKIELFTLKVYAYHLGLLKSFRGRILCAHELSKTFEKLSNPENKHYMSQEQSK